MLGGGDTYRLDVLVNKRRPSRESVVTLLAMSFKLSIPSRAEHRSANGISYCMR